MIHVFNISSTALCGYMAYLVSQSVFGHKTADIFIGAITFNLFLLLARIANK